MKQVVPVLGLLLCALTLGAQEENTPVADHPAVKTPSVVSVLAYCPFSASEDKIRVSAERFARQLDYLKNNGLTPISPAQFLAWRRGEISLPPHAVLITLERADASAYEVAFPLLRERGIPFLIFADIWNMQGGGASRSLNREQLRAMQQAGAVIGSRTTGVFPAYEWQFAALSGEEEALAARELGDFGERLRREFGSCDFLAEPQGYDPNQLEGYLARYGYAVAFVETEGKVSRQSASFRLPRNVVLTDADFARAVNFGDASKLPEIQARLEGRESAAPEPEDVPPATPAFAFEDDDEAEEVDDEDTTPAPELRWGQLVRRSGGDWETSHFAAPLVPREQTRVAVLGYHNFSNTKPVSEMRMRTSEFCTQMQYIKDAGLSVITMEDFLQWLRGERQLPERCILITIDDGWKSVWTDAYPVLKAYGYPFTTFLYTRYIQVQGDSMTKAQIQEMAAHGATIGSHSTNHLYPKSWRRFAQGSEAYTAQVKHEILDSRDKLVSLFGPCSAYCYPGGYNTPPMLEALRASDYRAAFTVLEAKVTTEEDPYLIHRYMVFGNNASIFRRAVNFDGQEGVRPAQEGIRAAEAPARAFFPAAFPTEP